MATYSIKPVPFVGYDVEIRKADGTISTMRGIADLAAALAWVAAQPKTTGGEADARATGENVRGGG